MVLRKIVKELLKLFMCMSTCVSGCMCPQMPERDVESLGAGLTDGLLPDIGGGNQIPVLWKSNAYL